MDSPFWKCRPDHNDTYCSVVAIGMVHPCAQENSIKYISTSSR